LGCGIRNPADRQLRLPLSKGETMLIEYKVRPVTRYNVTRFKESDEDIAGNKRSGSSVVGTYDNEDVAHEVGYALCKAEHDRLGWPIGDERIQYPRRGVKTESS